MGLIRKEASRQQWGLGQEKNAHSSPQTVASRSSCLEELYMFLDFMLHNEVYSKCFC